MGFPHHPRLHVRGLAWKQYASRHTSGFERQALRAFKSIFLRFFFGLAIGSTISVPRRYLVMVLLASDGASGPVALRTCVVCPISLTSKTYRRWCSTASPAAQRRGAHLPGASSVWADLSTATFIEFWLAGSDRCQSRLELAPGSPTLRPPPS